ncbi:MAG: hypothetical protein JF570_04675, partial [Caulobacter sp.]|nr:hypothetical protein [Caulobacter sp.]
MTVRSRRLAISALLASTIAASASLAGIPAFAQSSVAHPAQWPAAASPAAITDAKTEAFISQLMAR